MKTRIVRSAFSALLTFSCAAALAWSGDPTVNDAVSTASNPQENPQITPDGSGGVVIAWEDMRDGNRNIYAQRLNASGAPLWAINGVKVCGATGVQNSIRIVSDGQSGAIIAWADFRSDSFNNDIYAQRINNGTVQWATDGLPVCTAAGTQSEMQIVRDANNGAIITWTDARNGAGDVYGQRIDTTGNQVWQGDGLPICTETNGQTEPQLCIDGLGGAIFTWRDGRVGGTTDVYAQRVNAAGVKLWTANGDAISTHGATQKSPAIASDGNGGAIVAFVDQRDANEDIYAQRISSLGQVQWAENGLPAAAGPSDIWSFRIVSDTSNGAILTWQDGGHNIYAQRISSSGATLWTPAEGVTICNAPERQSDPEIIADGAGGAIMCWVDLRVDGFNQDIYAQKVNSAGAVQWAANGLGICTSTDYKQRPQLATDTIGGAIVTWQDGRSDGDIYASHATAAGALPVSLSQLTIE